MSEHGRTTVTDGRRQRPSWSVWPEERLRDRIERTGGHRELTPAELLQALGVRRVGEGTLVRIEQSLRREGVVVDPSPLPAERGSRIRLRIDPSIERPRPADS